MSNIRIQNRWIIFILFLSVSLILLISLSLYNNEKSVDLTDLSINNLHLNEQFNSNEYKINRNIKLDRYQFYNDQNHENLTVKIKKHDNHVKGIVLIKDKNVKTNFGVQIGDTIDQAIINLGEDYKKSKVGGRYESIIYYDKAHRMKLTILYKDDLIKRIEFFSH